MTYDNSTDKFVFTRVELEVLLRETLLNFVLRKGVYDFSEDEALEGVIDTIMNLLACDEPIPFLGEPIPQPDSVGGVVDLGLEPAF